MTKITNTSKTPYGLPLLNRRHIEIRPGTTVEFPDADLEALANRKDVRSLFESGKLIAVGSPQPQAQQEQEAPAEPATKPARAKKG